jgi:hypothetical protein
MFLESKRLSDFRLRASVASGLMGVAIFFVAISFSTLSSADDGSSATVTDKGAVIETGNELTHLVVDAEKDVISIVIKGNEVGDLLRKVCM